MDRIEVASINVDLFEQIINKNFFFKLMLTDSGHGV